MIPWELLDSAPIPDGSAEMTLHRRGDEYAIRVGYEELMNSRQHGSEDEMARLAWARHGHADAPRILVGGLGMGFTLASTNRVSPPGAHIDVVELMDAVIRWNRGPLGALAGQPLDDPRVRVVNADVREVLEARADTYDVVLLDVDNGPDGLTQDDNAWLYGPAGLAATRRALRPGGVLSVWSAAPDAAFTRRLSAAGFQSKTHIVRARAGRKGARHTIWVATVRRARAR